MYFLHFIYNYSLFAPKKCKGSAHRYIKKRRKGARLITHICYKIPCDSALTLYAFHNIQVCYIKGSSLLLPGSFFPK
jgi:hypothetical protein